MKTITIAVTISFQIYSKSMGSTHYEIYFPIS